MVIHTDIYMDVFFDEENRIIEHFWKETSANLNDELFKKQLVIFGDLILKLKPKAVTADTTKFLFAMSPEIQQWIGENFFSKVIEAGCKKYALQVSPDVFTQLSIESVIDDESKQAFVTKYFDSLESAKKWAIE